MKTLLFLLLLSVPAFAQQSQCPLRYMWQYYPPAQVNAWQSVKNDSTTSYLIAYSQKDGFSSTISPSVGWTVDGGDSFGVFLRTDSAVFIVIQHDGVLDAFDIDTTVTGPIYWHEVAVAVTPGNTNYSVMLYPINPTGPLRSTVFDVPVYFGAAYEWNAKPIASVSANFDPIKKHPVKWYDILGRRVDSSHWRGPIFSNDGRKKWNP